MTKTRAQPPPRRRVDEREAAARSDRSWGARNRYQWL